MISGAVFFLALVLSVAATAESDPGAAPSSVVPESELWAPSLSMGFFLHYQDQEASVLSGPGSELTGGTGDEMVSPGFRFDAAIATPVLFDVSFAPRLYAQIGTNMVLEDSFVAYRAISSGGVAAAITEVEMSSFLNSEWYAGLGLETVLPVWERRIRIGTAVNYVRQDIGYDGKVTETRRSATAPTEIREWEANGASITTQGVGFNVAVNARVWEWQDLRLSLFLGTRFTWLLDKGDSTFVAGQVSGPPPAGGPEFVTFQGAPGNFIAQGEGGLRVTWHPRW